MTPFEISEKYNVDIETVHAAMDKIATNEVLFLAVSGRIGAGKDTVAPRVVEELGFDNAHHESFAGPLRAEVNRVIECIKRARDFDHAMELVKEDLDPINYREVVEALYEDVKAGRVTNSYERTESTRRALQWWGTEVRRAVDSDYWVKQAVKSSLGKLANGQSIYVTDARFPNEASAVTNLTGMLIRLQVSLEEQRRRIMSRDGIEPNESAISHDSETALDEYPFDNVINTDSYNTEETIELAVSMTRHYMGKRSVNANS